MCSYLVIVVTLMCVFSPCVEVCCIEQGSPLVSAHQSLFLSQLITFPPHISLSLCLPLSLSLSPPSLTFTEQVDHIVVGTVIQEVKTSNIAREVSHSHSPYTQHCMKTFMYTLTSDNGDILCLCRQQWSLGSVIVFPATQSPWLAYRPTWP